jgi:iron complex outermembrane receptor protein
MLRKTRLALACALAALPAVALAQEGGLEEIVVTAQKRTESLQDTPIAISAFNAEALEQQGIADIQDLNGYVPNVQINPSPGGSTGATVAIRGSVTINPAVTWEPTVGMYLDGAFIGKNLGGIFDVADLERIEVLRGPQGSLYGKNTVGGAINLISRRPSGELGGRLLAGIGDEGYYRVLGSLDTPAIGEMGSGLGKLSANITLQHEERDGYIENRPDPYGMPFTAPPSTDDYANIDADAGRIALLLEVTENFSARYSYDFSDKDQNPSASVLTAVDPQFAPDPALLPALQLLSVYVQSPDEYPDWLSNDESRFEKSEVDGHALHLDYNLGDTGWLGEVSLKSITSYRELAWDDWLDLDGSPIDAFHSARFIDYDQTSQEFQVVGGTDAVKYVFGLYWFEENVDVDNPITFFGAFGAPTAPNAYGLEGESKAVYGQVDWKPSAAVLEDRLTISVGARWTEEQKDQYIDHPVVTVPPFIPFAAEADESWNNFAPSATVDWAFTDSVNAYIRYAEGWKSGGFNGESDNLAGFLQAYDPEEVTSVELGLKSRWLDDRLQLNAAVFSNEIEDMQLSIFVVQQAASVVDNAGKANIQGAELELLAEPVDNLQLSLNYGWLDPEYDEYIDGGVDVADNRDFPYSPENTANAAVQYTLPGVAGGELVGRLDYVYVDDRVAYPDPLQNLRSQLDSYELWNARLSLADVPVGDGSVTVAAWGKNLADEEYRTNTIPFVFWTVSYFGQPRSYGLDVSYAF